MYLALLAQAAPSHLDTSSFVSVGVLIVVLGAAVRVSTLLARIDEKLQNALLQLGGLAPVPGKVALLEQRMDRAETDLDELWAVHRGDGNGRRRDSR